MKVGDMIFVGNRVVAKVTRNIPVPDGMVYRFQWLLSRKHLIGPTGDPTDHDRMEQQCVITEVQRIFRRGTFQIWEMVIPDGADMDVSWSQFGFFDHYTPEPSTDAAGMVAAIDLVLLEMNGRGGWQTKEYLKRMRQMFHSYAQSEKVVK